MSAPARVSRFFLDLALFAVPAGAAGLLCWLLTPSFDLQKADRAIEAGIVASLIGSSFTAAFFLVALPRSGHLERLDKANRTMGFTVMIMLPALIGTIQLAVSYFSEVPSIDKARANWLGTCASFLFVSTLLYFLQALVVVLRIVQLQRRAPTGPRRVVTP